jgi:hypothetical protein
VAPDRLGVAGVELARARTRVRIEGAGQGEIINLAGEHPDLAWAFVQANFTALAQKQGQSFRDTFASNLLTNFADAAHVAELASFAPVHETSGGRRVAERAHERIMTDADFAAQQLPAV